MSRKHTPTLLKPRGLNLGIKTTEKISTREASKPQRRSGTDDQRDPTEVVSVDKSLAKSLSTCKAPVKNLTGSGVGPGTRKRPTNGHGSMSRELFKYECEED